MRGDLDVRILFLINGFENSDAASRGLYTSDFFSHKTQTSRCGGPPCIAYVFFATEPDKHAGLTWPVCRRFDGLVEWTNKWAVQIYAACSQ